jgi:hypothetical protein
MKIVIQKKITLFILTVFLILSLIGVYIYIRPFNDEDNSITVYDFFYKCEEFGCIQTEEDEYIVKDIPITVLSVEESWRFYTLNIEVWNSNTNDIKSFILSIRKDLIDESIFDDNIYPKNYDLKISVKENIIPLPYISDYLNKILFVKQHVARVLLTDQQSSYFDEGKRYNYKKISSDIEGSLTRLEGFSESGNLPSMVFVFDDTVSYGYSSLRNYEQILLYEVLGIASEKSPEALADNCNILKKYYSNEQCNATFKDLKTPWIDQILNYDILHYDIEEVVKNSIVANTDTVYETRTDKDLWYEYHSAKNLTLAKEIDVYIKSFLEFLYFSNLSCSDAEYVDTCDEIYKLYEYSKSLISTSKGNFCTYISYLPLLSIVSKDSDITDELEYILQEYPFESECTYSDQYSGFCSLDLEERFSCMELMYNSVVLLGNNSDIEDQLRSIVDFSLMRNLDNYKDRVGLWGSEDINLLNFGTLDENYYPIRFYDMKGNYSFNKILENFYNE